jgi:trimeric autotransporter adhesin
MKTLPTLATAVIAAFLVLGPAVAFAATTVTVATNSNSYNGVQTVSVTGTVTPAPGPSTNVVITTRGPSGVVDINSVPVNSGAYSYAFVTGGSTNWVQGTYTVNATVAVGASATTTFTYTPSSGPVTVGGGGPMGIDVQVTAQTPVFPGQQEYIAVLTSYASNGSLAAATFQTIHYHTPQGTLVTLCSSAGQTGCTGTFTTVHTGFYTINFSVPATATLGGYFVHAWTNGPKNTASTGQGQGLGQFTVNPNIAQNSGFAALTTSETGIQSTLTTIQSSLGAISGLTTGLASLTTSVNSLTSTVNTVSSGVTTISNGLTSVTQAAANISSLSSKLDTVNSNVANSQTYVLVVAALAAITLVLELAILVRKLS